MKPAKPRPCPHCGASPTKSRPHCDRCDWRRCYDCKGLYNDTTRKTTQEES